MTTARSRAATAGILALVLPVAMAIVARAWISALPRRTVFASLDRFFLYGPFQEHLGRTLAQGRLPHWNPLLGLGINDAADISLGPLYPPNFIFGVCSVSWGDEILTLGHVAIAALAMFLLARSCSVGLAGAAVSGVVVATGITFHSLAYWASMLATFTWCPVAFLAARRLGDRPCAARALQLAAVLGLQILAGYLQLHLYTVICLPLFFLPARRLAAVAQPLAWAAAAELVATGLAAAALVPGMAAIALSWRSGEAVPELLFHIFPVHLRDYLTALAAPATALAPRVPVFAGPLLPPLILAGVLARGVAPRLRVPALALTTIAVVLSLGDSTPVYPLLRYLPISHWFTGPYKWTYLSAVGLTLLAGVGSHALLAPSEKHAFPARLWAALALLSLVALPMPVRGRVIAAASIVALLVVARRPTPRLRAIAAAALPVLVGLTALATYTERGTTPADAPEFFTRYGPAYAYLAARQDDGRTYVLIPQETISTRQGEIEGVAQLNTNGVIVSYRLAQYTGAVQTAVKEPAHERALALLRALGARFIMTASGAHGWLGDTGLERVFESPAADVWRDAAALPRAYLAHTVEHVPAGDVLTRLGDPTTTAAGTAVLEVEEGPGGTATTGAARIVRATDSEVVVSVNAAGPGVLVLLDAWSPDWRALVDGRPATIRHANWLARAVEVPAGEHQVTFEFAPVKLYTGLAISAATVLGCLIGTVLIWRSARVPSATRSQAR